MEYHPCRTRSRSPSGLSKNFTGQVHPQSSLFYCDSMLILLWFQIDCIAIPTCFIVIPTFCCESKSFSCDFRLFIVIPGWGFGLLMHRTLTILPQQPEQTLKWKNTVKTQMTPDNLLLCYNFITAQVLQQFYQVFPSWWIQKKTTSALEASKILTSRFQPGVQTR